MAMLIPMAIWQVFWNGLDITSRLNPRLSELTLTEKSGNEADELSLTINDPSIELAMPKKGDEILVHIGWSQGDGLPTGLVNKGKFIVSDFTLSGDPDIMQINAKSANFTTNHHARRPHQYIDKSLGEIIGEIAANMNLSARIDPDLQNIAADPIIRIGKSNLAVLRELGRIYDAIATIKNNVLIFSRHGAAQTPSGNQLPNFTISRTNAPKYNFSAEARAEATGTEAQYHDRRTAQTQTIGNGGAKPRRLRRIHGSHAAAERAAQTHQSQNNRAKNKLELNLPLGRPDISPPAKITAQNYRPEIDAINWKVVETTHTFGANGLSTKLMLESV